MNDKMFTIGADPELFLFDNTKNEIISVIGMIGGSKREPLFISDRGHNVQEDNVLLEFGIPPSNNSDEFKHNINFVLDYINNVYCISNNYSISNKASNLMNPIYLDNEKALSFGCEPDFNVYTLDINMKSFNVDPTLRSAGGHVHIGYENPSMGKSIDLIKAMDLYLGVPSVLMDEDTERRNLYGKAGCFRFKDYGFEYRTLSNFWIFNNDSIDWVYNQTVKAFNHVNNKSEILNTENIIKCINTSDKKLAEKIINQNKSIVA